MEQIEFKRSQIEFQDFRWAPGKEARAMHGEQIPPEVEYLGSRIDEKEISLGGT